MSEKDPLIIVDRKQLLEEYGLLREKIDWHVELLSNSNRERENSWYIRLKELELLLDLPGKSE